jgi:hypothetical protein
MRFYITGYVCLYLQFQINLTPVSVLGAEARLAVIVEPPPPGLEMAYQTLLTPNAIQFVAELAATFDKQVDEVPFSYIEFCKPRSIIWACGFITGAVEKLSAKSGN